MGLLQHVLSAQLACSVHSTKAVLRLLRPAILVYETPGKRVFVVA